MIFRHGSAVVCPRPLQVRSDLEIILFPYIFYLRGQVVSFHIHMYVENIWKTLHIFKNVISSSDSQMLSLWDLKGMMWAPHAYKQYNIQVARATCAQNN